MLKNVPIFHELTNREILEVDEISSCMSELTRPDEIIFEEGDQGHGVFIIISGKVRKWIPCHKLLEDQQIWSLDSR